ncbi:hypothetical protein ACFQ4O_01940 [Methylopila musalis]|uniref:Uncharacterized protein n=1 Tax=Methylopila musalis TaxID=1134781 RepID=A0ABW3Z492_9HYPH
MLTGRGGRACASGGQVVLGGVKQGVGSRLFDRPELLRFRERGDAERLYDVGPADDETQGERRPATETTAVAELQEAARAGTSVRPVCAKNETNSAI